MPPVATYSPHSSMGVANAQAYEVKLEILANKLRDRDLITKSDPCAVVFLEKTSVAPGAANPHWPSATVLPEEVSTWEEQGRTECIKNNLNPHFAVHVTVPYHFEQLQNIRIGIWDIDSKSNNLEKHDFLGEIRTTLGDLVASKVCTAELLDPDKKYNRKLPTGKRNLGTITIIVHENHIGNQLLVKARFSGKKLARRDGFSSDPYLIISQVGMHTRQSCSEVYRTEFIKRNLNPQWQPVSCKLHLPKGGNSPDINLKLICNDKNNLTTDSEIGVAECTLEELQNAESLPLICTRKKGRRRYTNSGLLIVRDLAVVRLPSLIEYLQGGLKLHFNVAIDMTASNGNPRNPTSLHFQGQSNGGNQYVNALMAIGTVLQTYAPSDAMFSAYGFGAELPGLSGASSCFSLNMRTDPRCHGVQGILNAYTTALNTVKLSGPTNFAPLIDTVMRAAAERPNDEQNQNYDVLLIMTDGIVTDFKRTVDKIIEASYTAPLSIIIIGIGNAGFKPMKFIDSDNKLLTSVDGKRTAARDIVQFVPFRDYLTAPLASLAAAVLSEMPENIIDYFVSARNPPIMPGIAPSLPVSHNGGLTHA